MRTTWTFHSAGQLLFGRGAVQQLGEAVRRLGGQHVFVVTDPALVQAGWCARVCQVLQEAGRTVTVFAEGEPEPSFAVAQACLAQARTAAPDVVLGLGGGSNLDLAKITATLLAHGGQPADYVGEERVPGPIVPLVALPTTAGTGSEVSAAAVLTDPATQMKVGILSNYLRPRLALVDPMLTVSCPPAVTAASGLDALTHALEAYLAVDNADFPLPAGEPSVYQGKHPLGDLLAEKAIALIGQYLRRAVHNGQDLEAREGLALAATLAGLAFSNVGVALVHALEYPLGAATHCPHGVGNGLLLPYVLRFNLPVRQRELAQVARLLGEETTGLSLEQAAERAIAAVERLRAEVGIPLRLRDLGVRREQLSAFAEKACSIRRLLRVNPRPITVAQAEELLQAAW